MPQHLGRSNRKPVKWWPNQCHAPDGVVQGRRQHRRHHRAGQAPICPGNLRASCIFTGVSRWMGHPSLVSVAAQMGARRNVVPLVLAEMLMGLDLVYTGQTNTFSGSPLLLQLWLSDKIGLLAAPEAH
ncbi:hypothetical protein RHMOL_Rhmol05G0162700 [Rhododendron molle]|uniref:Uncharacterized protein n=1 Tax=Rhododendron molle TaxID=49168 RepID=A0ACC0NR39_RHOML|nr:hypothetical protein RHMOL_Rhmol05G0162700 [Rhododendron molle]